ncbi:flagellar brake protein [Alcaligenaceae bacterium B3P038]|nr:flagellar brake protein [Alcaligenaceae bacterium B3P038]
MLSETPPDFLLTDPDEIRSALFELTHAEAHVVVRDAADREIAVLIIGLDRKTGTFFWRPRDYASSNFADNKELLIGAVFQFICSGYGGVRIHFRVPRPDIVRFDDGSATFVSHWPDRISRIQRRKMFRASLSTQGKRCRASWQPPGGEPALVFGIRDVSVDGIGLRCALPVGALPQRGDTLERVMLDFGEFGTLQTSLEVRNVFPTSGQGKREENDDEEGAPDERANGAATVAVAPVAATVTASTKLAVAGQTSDTQTAVRLDVESHVGAVFSKLSSREEIWLQQVVWRLEKSKSD